MKTYIIFFFILSLIGCMRDDVDGSLSDGSAAGDSQGTDSSEPDRKIDRIDPETLAPPRIYSVQSDDEDQGIVDTRIVILGEHFDETVLLELVPVYGPSLRLVVLSATSSRIEATANQELDSGNYKLIVENDRGADMVEVTFLKGEKGEKGEMGETGAPGDRGPMGPLGPPGNDGLAIEWVNFDSETSTNPIRNQAYRDPATGISYIYDGTAWQILVRDGKDIDSSKDPTINSSPVLNALEVNQLFEYEVSAKDPYQARLGYALTEAPEGMEIDGTSGLLQWTPKPFQENRIYPIKIIAFNEDGGLDAQFFSLEVKRYYFDFDLTMTGMTASIGRAFFARLIDSETGLLSGFFAMGQIVSAEFTVHLAKVFHLFGSYRLDCFIDANGSGRYEAPFDGNATVQPGRDMSYSLYFENILSDAGTTIAATADMNDIVWPHETIDVSVDEGGFHPAIITMTTRQILRVENSGTIDQTLDDIGGAFSTGIILAGEHKILVFAEPGSYSFRSTPNPALTGTLTVTDHP